MADYPEHTGTVRIKEDYDNAINFSLVNDKGDGTESVKTFWIYKTKFQSEEPNEGLDLITDGNRITVSYSAQDPKPGRKYGRNNAFAPRPAENGSTAPNASNGSGGASSGSGGSQGFSAAQEQRVREIIRQELLSWEGAGGAPATVAAPLPDYDAFLAKATDAGVSEKFIETQYKAIGGQGTWRDASEQDLIVLEEKLGFGASF